MITLIDKVNDSDYDSLEFPDLNEISEFFLLYRANGLKSLGKLFPNLRVIRGNQLINDFSFIVFEMMHLQVLIAFFFNMYRNTLFFIKLIYIV